MEGRLTFFSAVSALDCTDFRAASWLADACDRVVAANFELEFFCGGKIYTITYTMQQYYILPNFSIG